MCADSDVIKLYFYDYVRRLVISSLYKTSNNEAMLASWVSC